MPCPLNRQSPHPFPVFLSGKWLPPTCRTMPADWNWNMTPEVRLLGWIRNVCPISESRLWECVIYCYITSLWRLFLAGNLWRSQDMQVFHTSFQHGFPGIVSMSNTGAGLSSLDRKIPMGYPKVVMCISTKILLWKILEISGMFWICSAKINTKLSTNT